MSATFQVGSFYLASTTYHRLDTPVIFQCCRRADKSVWLQRVQSPLAPVHRVKIHAWFGEGEAVSSERATYDQWHIYSYRLASDEDFARANLKPPHHING